MAWPRLLSDAESWAESQALEGCEHRRRPKCALRARFFSDTPSGRFGNPLGAVDSIDVLRGPLTRMDWR